MAKEKQTGYRKSDKHSGYPLFGHAVSEGGRCFNCNEYTTDALPIAGEGLLKYICRSCDQQRRRRKGGYDEIL